MKVLIAEDDGVTRSMLREQFMEWGYETVEAADGREAWEKFQSDPVPLVISDWQMPKMNGLELLQRIRAAEGGRYAYVILLTALRETQDLVKGMEAGADDFVSKPFDQNELRVRLRAGERIIGLQQTLADKNALLASANHRMKQDLDAAAELQRSLLPAILPNDQHCGFAWSYRPCDELAGDILGVFPLGDEAIGFYLADVAGHGVAASLLSVSISRVLNPAPSSSSLLMRPDGRGGRCAAAPSHVLRELNQRFPMMGSGGRFFSIVYGILDTTTRELRLSSAGHPPSVLLSRDRSAAFLEADGIVIGVLDDYEYEERKLTLEAGDRMFLYSDGLTEQPSASGEQFGDFRLCEQIIAGRSRPLAEAVESLEEAVVSWSGHERLTDDLSLLAFEVR